MQNLNISLGYLFLNSTFSVNDNWAKLVRPCAFGIDNHDHSG